MTPIDSAYYSVQGSQTYVIFFGKIALCLAIVDTLPYSAHKSICKFGVRVRFARTTCVAVSPLCHLIGAIVGISPQKEMLGIRARWVVALMQNLQAIWNRAKVNFPRKAMGAHSPFVYAKQAIAKFVFSAFPIPALTVVTNDNHVPKAFCGRVLRLVLMAFHESKRLVLCPSLDRIAIWSKRSSLSAAAYAKAVWIQNVIMGTLPSIMTANESFGLAFNPSISRTGSLGNRRGLTASTFTEFYFLRGIMELHRNLPFFAKPGTVAAVARQFLLGRYSCNYSTKGLK